MTNDQPPDSQFCDGTARLLLRRRICRKAVANLRGAAALALSLCILGAGLTPASAKECTDEKAGSGTFGKSVPSARMTIKNETTNTPIRVEMWRGGTIKKEMWVYPEGKVPPEGKRPSDGDFAEGQTTYLAQMAGYDRTGRFKVQMYPTTATRVIECEFKVAENPPGTRLQWILPDGAESVCPVTAGFGMVCKKKFQKNKYRWLTIFTVKDPFLIPSNLPGQPSPPGSPGVSQDAE